MKFFTFSFKSLLVAAGLLLGSANVWGETLLFSEDFESAASPSAVGWTLTGGTGTIETSSDASINKYAKFIPSSTNGNRGQSYGFSAENVTSAGNCWKVEFDAAFKSGADRNESSVAVTGANTENITTNNAASGALYFLCKQSANNSQTYNIYIGNSADASSGSYTLTANTFYHFVISYDGTKVTAKIGTNAAISKSVNSSTTGAIKGLKTCESRSAGVVSIDNIKLYSLIAPAFTLSENSKTVSVSGSETVNVTGITGSISVSSNNTSVATASYDAGVVTINGLANGVATVTVTGTNDGLTLDKTIDVTVGSVSTTTVTVNYLCGETPIADALELTDVVVGSFLTASEVVYDEVIYGTGCRYVNPVLSESLPYTVVEDGVINITYTQQNSVASLNVKAQVGSTKYDIKTESLSGKYVGDKVTLYYPRLWLVGTTLYSTTQDAHGDGYYKWDYTLDGNDAVIEYNTTEATNVVYYSEGEDIEGMTADASGNGDIRCSGGKGGRSADELSLTTLEDGVYKLSSRVWGGKGYTYTYRAAGADVFAHSTTGALDDKNAYINVLSGTAAIKVQGVNTGGKVLDYVYIQKIAESDGLIFNGDFSNATWNAGWLGTGSDKKTAFVKQSSAGGFDGTIAEMWTDAAFTAEGNIYQVLINVPAGDYVVSANILNNVAGGAAVLYAKVGSADDVTTAAAGLATKTEKTLAFTVSEVSNVIIGYKTTNITGKTGWIAVDDFRFVVPLTISEAGYASFSSYKPLDLDNISGATAYIVKADAASGDNIVITPQTGKVAANTGLILKGAAGTVTIPVAASGTDISATNKLVAVTADATAVDAGNYVLGAKSDNSKVGLYRLASATTLNKGQAYLPGGFSSVKVLNFIIEGETPTGVETVQGEGFMVNDEYYNLNGQRVTADYKGIVIKNGKKYLNK